MKIIVDKMPEYPYECCNCRLEKEVNEISEEADKFYLGKSENEFTIY